MKNLLISLFIIFCSSCSNDPKTDQVNKKSIDLTINQLNKKNKGIEVKEKVPGYQHHDGLWFAKDKHNTYSDLASYLYNNFIKKNNFKTILELGSGAGSLAYFLRQFDPTLVIVTTDGNKKTYKSPYVKSKHHFIARTDEDLEFVDGNKNRIIFDFVISFEHFEHIQHERFHTVLDNIKKHMNEKTLCFCSAATWGGPGVYEPHCNVKTLSEWENYLTSQGFEILDTKLLTDVPHPFNFTWDRSHKLLFRLFTK
ncbi:MAG: hypothetical protein KR126chlam4_01046 [Candidatus Anoxychlamydiales bacterium]|nr:hypothetical protein [Candidatus Anoxychlamydiales bacterium]NGX41207.1 hypothetical protein [Candidatus Anoxychlamydiales bacterium]